VIAAACAACGLIIASTACIWCAMDGPGAARLRRTARHYLRVARYHLLRRRYARRMRGPLPDRDQGVPYCRREWLATLDAWDEPAARTERTRT
jgi:hypothetical protein